MGTRKLGFERVDVGHEAGDSSRIKKGCRKVNSGNCQEFRMVGNKDLVEE